MVRRALFAGAAIALAQAWQADAATAATIIERTLPVSNQPGSRTRQYKIAVPDNFVTGAPVPVVMVLHGCLQTHRDTIHDTRFVELVDRKGLIAVFPFVSSFPSSEQRRQNCWGFWSDQHQHEGRGEPGDLRRILAEVEGEFPIDSDRRYVVGLSSGAAMAVIMAVNLQRGLCRGGLRCRLTL
jgi:poly(3-hydroxybutyrate) depolymerase